MPRTYVGHKLDANHKEIKEDLLAANCTVTDNALYGMSLDMTVLKHGVTVYLEVKNPERLSKAQMANRELSLTPDEVKVKAEIERNDGIYVIAINSKEVLDVFSAISLINSTIG